MKGKLAIKHTSLPYGDLSCKENEKSSVFDSSDLDYSMGNSKKQEEFLLVLCCFASQREAEK